MSRNIYILYEGGLLPVIIQLGSEPIFNCDISFLGTFHACDVLPLD